jgi:hypothetical protein
LLVWLFYLAFSLALVLALVLALALALIFSFYICATFKIIVENSDKLISGFFWFCMTVTGFMGFAIGLVTVMQVKATSPLTHNISGTAKAAVQVRYTLLHTENDSVSGCFVFCFPFEKGRGF